MVSKTIRLGSNPSAPANNMFYVYLLTDTTGKIYIGYTSNLERRISEHQAGKVFTTKKMDQPVLFYFEAYKSRDLATQREKQLKQFGSSYVGLLKRIKLK